MNIGIIGSGNVGKALAGAASKSGHAVKIAASDPDHAKAAAEATGARPAASAREVIAEADLVVLAVPATRVDEVLGTIGPELDGKVVVDVTNRVNRQEPGLVLDGSSMGEHVQQKVPKAKVVKAFNYAFASRMIDPQVDGMRLDGYVAGDDPAAKQKVMEFAESIGFRPIDVGPLVMARALEAMALLMILLQIQHGWPWQSGWKVIGPTGQKG